MDVLLSTMTNTAVPFFEMGGHRVVEVVTQPPVPYPSNGRASVLAVNRAIEQANSLAAHKLAGTGVALVGVSKLFSCYSEILEAPYCLDDKRRASRSKTYFVRIAGKPLLVATAIAVILPGGGSRKDYNIHSVELKPFKQAELDFLSAQPEVHKAMGGLAWDIPGSDVSKMIVRHVSAESTGLDAIIGIEPTLLDKVF